MKKTTKKRPRASHEKALENLNVTPAKGGIVRGGETKTGGAGSGRVSLGELQISKVVDKSSP